MSNKDNTHVIKHTKQVEQINTDKINEMINRNMVGLKKLYTKLSEHEPSEDLVNKTADIIASSKLKKALGPYTEDFRSNLYGFDRVAGELGEEISKIK